VLALNGLAFVFFYISKGRRSAAKGRVRALEDTVFLVEVLFDGGGSCGYSSGEGSLLFK
jgi:uncharacterized membrane protein YsdA (DUF1294 family)